MTGWDIKEERLPRLTFGEARNDGKKTIGEARNNGKNCRQARMTKNYMAGLQWQKKSGRLEIKGKDNR
ncbi:hypothetical protein JCM13991_19260 [Thermodesulfovibrio hydrogeniphilus]